MRNTHSFPEFEFSIDAAPVSALCAWLLSSGKAHGFLGGSRPGPPCASAPAPTHLVGEPKEGGLAVKVVDAHLRERFRKIWMHHFLLVQLVTCAAMGRHMSHRMEGSRRGHHTKVEHQVEACEQRGRLWTEARLGWWHAQHELIVDRSFVVGVQNLSRLGGT
jgi:hypothetical protein